MATNASGKLAINDLQLHSHDSLLRRELGVTDLVLAQILFCLVPDFYGTAVKAGPSHVVLWLLAVVLFFLPQALLVTHLNRLMPLEGGLYEWSRLAFGDRLGFLTAWNLWFFATLYTAVIGLVAVNFAAYAIGPRFAWASSNRAIVIAVTFVSLLCLTAIARAGLQFAKWVSNFGSVASLITIAALIVMPFIATRRGSLANYHPFQLVAPPLDFFSLSVFTKMTFGALAGFEFVAILAGESRSPSKNLSRSIVVSAPIIILFYILGTRAILAYVSPQDLDVVGPIPQALSRGFGNAGLGHTVALVSILLLLFSYLATINFNFNTNSRLPLVAGWDRLLPPWFTRLHEKHRTPVNSILFSGIVTFIAALATLFGVGVQEAYELVLTWTFYGLAYLSLFAITLLARRDSGIRPAPWLRAISALAFLVTLLFVLLAAFPIIDVPHPLAYGLKTVAVVLGANAAGLLSYRLGRAKSNSATHSPNRTDFVE